MKWTLAKDGNYTTSDCGRYIVNWNDPKTQYMAVKLGKPDRGAWIGSVILKVGTEAPGLHPMSFLCRNRRMGLRP